VQTFINQTFPFFIMVWIKIEGTGREGIFVDGFLPPLEQLKRLEQQLSDSIYAPLYGLDAQESVSHEESFKRVACTLRREYHDKAEESGKANIHPCEIFFLKFDYGLLAPRSPFKSEIPSLEEGQYYQIVATYSYDHCECGEDCLKNTIRRTNFKLRSDSTYSNYQSFRGFCKLLLDEVMKPYIAPRLVAHNCLRHYGFDSDSRGF
jgi:hypothetical protein